MKPKQDIDDAERRGLSWAALVALLVLTLAGALVIAYLITVHNFPTR